MPHDSLPPPPLPFVPIVSQAPPYILHGHSKVAPFAVVQTIVFEDTHARMDYIEQLWTPHYGSCVSHSMASLIFILKNDFIH